MEGKRQAGSSSYFTADLFGTKESPPPSSSGIFASILSPPSMVVGRNASNSELMGSWQKQHQGNKDWISTKKGTAAQSTGGATCNILNKNKSSIVQEGIPEPCHLSSSLYYGGQDNYSNLPSSHAAGSYPAHKKGGEEDDPNGNSHGASRGNWWQGSLYY
ncbi:uncharacterized protein LOC123224955 [Mangifera indica]|uniref:uncharacterized protein LOC123224955 n=1 Tax=Mangifera indica TaxID=29780 RepID=UPI001CFA0EDF|nr:uncharacterized protein LOC123224955 [Mangifera indica]